MVFVWTARFKKDFKKLSPLHEQRLGEALDRLQADPRHPSLGVKKLEGTMDIWELRVTRSVRVTFQRVAGDVLLRRIGSHAVLDSP